MVGEGGSPPRCENIMHLAFCQMDNGHFDLGSAGSCLCTVYHRDHHEHKKHEKVKEGYIKALIRADIEKKRNI